MTIKIYKQKRRRRIMTSSYGEEVKTYNSWGGFSTSRTPAVWEDAGEEYYSFAPFRQSKECEEVFLDIPADIIGRDVESGSYRGDYGLIYPVVEFLFCGVRFSVNLYNANQVNETHRCFIDPTISEVTFHRVEAITPCQTWNKLV